MSFIEKVQSAVVGIIGREIDISQKALDALWFGSTRSYRPVTNMLASLAKASPSVGDLLLRNDFDPNRLGSRETEHKPDENVLQYLLTQVLTDPGTHRSKRQRGELTNATIQAKRNNRLTEFDILASLVEVATLSHHTAASTMLQWMYYPQDKYSREYYNEMMDSGYTQDWRKMSFKIADELAVKLPTELNRISVIDPDSSDWQFAFWWDSRRVRITPVGTFGAHNIQLGGQDGKQCFPARGNVLDPRSDDSYAITSSGIEELEWLVNSNANESAFQNFFQNNPLFLLGMEYKNLYPQLILEHDDGKLIPDFFLEYLDGGFLDILDLKRPSARIAKFPKNRQGLTAAVHESVNQLRTYRNWFDDRSNRQSFRKRYPGLDAYKPRIIVVMGRTSDFQSKVLRQMLKEDIPSFTQLWTYDDVLNRARRYLEFSRKV